MHGSHPPQEKPRLLLVCHVPPPVHGAAVMGKAVASSALLRSLFDVTLVPIRINAGLDSLQRFGLGKVWSSLKLCGEVAVALATKRPRAMYFTANISGFAFWRDFVIVLLCRGFAVGRIFHFHMKGLRENYRRSRLMRWAYCVFFHNADVVHLSQRLYDDVAPVVPPQRFHVVANGINVPANPAKVSAVPGEVPTVLFLSNLYESKGPLNLLAASHLVAAKGIRHKLVFAGAATEAHVVQTIRATRGHVKWVGAVEGSKKAALLAAADVFAFPSYYHFECQPLAVIEAMAYGKAIIASDEAAIPDLIEDGENGLLVRARAIDDIAAALEKLLSQPLLRQRLGAAARARYEREFTLGAFEARLAHTMTQLCEPQAACAGESVAARQAQ